MRLTLRKTDLAWAAGIIDGEGCIYIDRALAKQHATPGYTLLVKVGMGHKATIARLQELFGGALSKNYGFSEQRNVLWVWCVKSQMAENVLKAVLPYLRTKEKEATCALQFRLIRRSSWGRVRTTDKICAQREKFYWQLRKLKPRWRFYEPHISGVPA